VLAYDVEDYDLNKHDFNVLRFQKSTLKLKKHTEASFEMKKKITEI
jgi:hypothetical protein